MRRVRLWTGPGIILFGYSACSSLFLPHAVAQGSSPDIKQRMEAAASRQKTAVAAMAASVDRQASSVRHQLALTSGPTASFFTQPPPEESAIQLPPPPECDPLPPAEIDSLVKKASSLEGVAPALIRGVIEQESAFRPCAVSPKGALGLMQLMPQTAAALEVGDPFDPQDNVAAGTKLLRQLLQHYYGDLALTLGAYNAGPRRVDAEMTIPGIPETTNYVQRILSLLPMTQMRSLSFDLDLDH